MQKPVIGFWESLRKTISIPRAVTLDLVTERGTDWQFALPEVSPMAIIRMLVVQPNFTKHLLQIRYAQSDKRRNGLSRPLSRPIRDGSFVSFLWRHVMVLGYSVAAKKVLLTPPSGSRRSQRVEDA